MKNARKPCGCTHTHTHTHILFMGRRKWIKLHFTSSFGRRWSKIIVPLLALLKEGARNG